ncbi:hypothetical protein BCR35DRAFT_29687 [Leucosporidium creatinivorum]|uniref:Uncharacterized protein n=1 Tax=Leucosporidium creatinivorum TaxID=106004 RepID=A0A1Y2CI32_9BASI|nr:hypothetical protein BCR35DRAFT_29687 [Leucosporidium creatinivorum]
MTSAEVDAALAEVEPHVDRMLNNAALFPRYLRISWAMWTGWVLYAYLVAVQYFTYIKHSMSKVANLDSKVDGRSSMSKLRLAWIFATLTSALVTLLGIIYFGTSLVVAVWTKEILSNSYLLATVTLISL